MYFRRSDRRAVLIIMAFILFFWGGMMVERWLLRSSAPTFTLDETGMDSLSAPLSSPPSSRLSTSSVDVTPSASNRSSADDLASAASAFTPETFPFDPNTADSATFHRLGLTDWQIKNIYKYRARGGRYHRPEDFKRLYGMTPEVYDRLAPVIRIGKQFRYYDEKDFEADNVRRAHYDSLRHERAAADAARRDSLARRYPRQEKFTELVQLDLNTVDTTTLKKVPGIASVRARQIIRLRDRLGGFVSPEQLTEIDNFPEELLAWFKVDTDVLRRLNVNSASFSELARHPYIGADRARAIESYRHKYGKLNSLSELSLLPEFDEVAIRRIEPYIEY